MQRRNAAPFTLEVPPGVGGGRWFDPRDGGSTDFDGAVAAGSLRVLRPSGVGESTLLLR